MPNTLEAFEKWLVCFIGMVSAFLMVTCDLVVPLKKLREKLYNPTLFGGYEARDYQGLAWMTHHSICKFFKDGNTEMLWHIIADVKAKCKHGEDCLPPEMRAPPPIVSEAASAWVSHANVWVIFLTNRVRLQGCIAFMMLQTTWMHSGVTNVC